MLGKRIAEIKQPQTTVTNNLSRLRLNKFGFNQESVNKIFDALDTFTKLPSAQANTEKLSDILYSASNNSAALFRLATFFRDQERFQQACTDFSAIDSQEINIGEQSYHIANASFMGEAKEFSPNSDYSTGINYRRNSKLIAAITDGVTGFSAAKKYNTGRMAARLGIKLLQEYQDDISKITNSELEAEIPSIMQKISHDITERFQFAIDNGDIAFDPSLDCSMATMAAVFDAGDKFILVSMGDSLIFAFNENGIITDSVNEAHGSLRLNGITSGLGAAIQYDYSKLYQFGEAAAEQGLSIEQYLQANPQLIQELGIQIESLPSTQISIKVVDKAKIAGLVLCSDGICRNDNRSIDLLNHVIKQSSDSNNAAMLARDLLDFSRLSKSKDDKTVTVLIKQDWLN